MTLREDLGLNKRYGVNLLFSCSSASRGCSLVVRIPRCGRGDLGSNPSSHIRFNMELSKAVVNLDPVNCFL